LDCKRILGVDSKCPNLGGNHCTRKELLDWKKEQEKDLQTFRESIVEREALRHQKTLLEKDAEISRLQQELQNLKDLLASKDKVSKDEKDALVAALSTTAESDRNGSALSEEQIRKFVDELLTDEAINIGYLPDWVERQLYINFFNLLIGLLSKTIATTSIELIGHKVNMVMLPKELTAPAKSVQTNDDGGETPRA